MNDVDLLEIFNKEAISKRAKEEWDSKSLQSKQMSGRKYKHIVIKFDKKPHNWKNSFDSLSLFQKWLLIKGEIIRTYDNLPNSDKTKIKNMLKLSEFSPKWFRLKSSDKNLILNYIKCEKKN